MEKNVHESQEKAFNEEQIVGSVLDFEDPDHHKSTTVKIVGLNEVLGSGSVADWVASVNVEIANEDGSDQKTRTMVLKHYADHAYRSMEIIAQTMRVKHLSPLQESYENYQMLKGAGIATWKTFRINEKKRVALMTLGADDGEVLRTTNDREYALRPRDQMLVEHPLTEIENRTEYLEEIRSILDKADMLSLALSADSWGTVFAPSEDPEKSGSYILHALICDFDSLEKLPVSPITKALFGRMVKKATRKRNLDELSAALFGIFLGESEEKRALADGIVKEIDPTFEW